MAVARLLGVPSEPTSAHFFPVRPWGGGVARSFPPLSLGLALSSAEMNLILRPVMPPRLDHSEIRASARPIAASCQRRYGADLPMRIRHRRAPLFCWAAAEPAPATHHNELESRRLDGIFLETNRSDTFLRRLPYLQQILQEIFAAPRHARPCWRNTHSAEYPPNKKRPQGYNE